MSELKPHELRVVKEQEELQERLMSLNGFLNKGQPETIDDHSWDLLQAQAFSMRSYNYVLLARIRLFKK